MTLLKNVKGSILLFVIILLPVLCSGKKELNDLILLNLNGRVKSVKERIYSAEEEGNEIRNSHIIKVMTYLYNERGNQVEMNEFDASGKSIRKSVSIYDNNGNLKERNWYDPDEKLVNKSTFRYDDMGNEIERDSFNPDKSLSSRSTSEYDSNNHLIKLITYSPDGNIYNLNAIRNDDKGREIDRIISYPDGAVEMKSTSRYDDLGNLVEKNEYPSCCMSVKYEYKYDAKGNQTEEISLKADGTAGIKYAYKYTIFDQEGNWLNKISFENNKPVLITHREIKYLKTIPDSTKSGNAGNKSNSNNN